MTVTERVHDLLAPVVATLGVELFDVEFTGGSLRVTVDEEPGITTERLAEVNRLISPLLDQHDPIPGRYTLEVSSPGLERPLKTTEHLRRAIGEQVVIKLVPESDVRRIRGSLVDADDTSVVVDATEIDGVERNEAERRPIERSTIATARTVFEWGPAPKPGGNKNKRSKKTKSRTPSQNRGAR